MAYNDDGNDRTEMGAVQSSPVLATKDYNLLSLPDVASGEVMAWRLIRQVEGRFGLRFPVRAVRPEGTNTGVLEIINRTVGTKRRHKPNQPANLLDFAACWVTQIRV